MARMTRAEIAKASPLNQARWIPMLCAEISESRIATKARPVGERSRFSTPSVMATHSTRQR